MARIFGKVLQKGFSDSLESYMKSPVAALTTRYKAHITSLSSYFCEVQFMPAGRVPS